jgi:hypothetical protein
VLELRDGTKKSDKQLIHSHEPAQNQTTSLLMPCWSTLVLGGAKGDLDLTRLTLPGLGRSHHFPPDSILCASPQGPYSNGIFVSRVPKLPKLELPQLCGPITLCADLRSR